jgi:hypothetical protein
MTFLPFGWLASKSGGSDDSKLRACNGVVNICGIQRDRIQRQRSTQLFALALLQKRRRKSRIQQHPAAVTHDSRQLKDRRPTHAERAFVRSRARQAARALFDAQLAAVEERASRPPGDETA